MSNSEVTFAVFDALLRETGLTKVEQADAVCRYVHQSSDTVVVVRIRDMKSPVPWGTLASTRKILDGRGILACDDFSDRRKVRTWSVIALVSRHRRPTARQMACVEGARGVGARAL